jgi:hypothetical protein
MDKKEAIDKLLAVMAEAERLGKLSNLQLIQELLDRPASEDAVVLEMMDRLCPGWEEDTIWDDSLPPELNDDSRP